MQPNQRDPLHRRAIAALVVVNLLWGISFPAMKAANMIMERQVAPAVADERSKTTQTVSHVATACFLMSVRFAVSIVLLGLFVPRLFVGLTAAQWCMGAWMGLAFAAGFLLQIVALNYIPASRSGFLTSLSVVFTPLIVIALNRRLPRWPVVAGIACGLLGTAVLTGLVDLSGSSGLRIAPDALGRIGLGDWLTTLAAFVFAVQILLIDRFSRRMPPGRLTPGMFVATLVFGSVLFLCVVAAGPSGRRSLAESCAGLALWAGLLADGPFVGIISGMSVFCTVLAFHWMNKYQAHVTPGQAALIYTLEPVFAASWAMVLPDVLSRIAAIDYPSERPGWKLLVGGALVVAGNALALWPAAGLKPREAEPD